MYIIPFVIVSHLILYIRIEMLNYKSSTINRNITLFKTITTEGQKLSIKN